MANDKKLLGFAIEKQSQQMIALASKMYTAFNDDSIVSLKLKGINLKKTNFINYHYLHELHELHELEDKCSIKNE
jgi:hypothetical protein